MATEVAMHHVRVALATSDLLALYNSTNSSFEISISSNVQSYSLLAFLNGDFLINKDCHALHSVIMFKVVD